LSSIVVAQGKLFVADVDAHAVCALDAVSGKPQWRYTAGGRVDSPPSIDHGLALFGCADGWVYCLRADDGQLVWRFRAAPDDERLVSYGQVESIWPVPGSVLVQDGSVCFVAGRCSYLDGGMHFYRLDAATGKLLAHQNIDSHDAPLAKGAAKLAKPRQATSTVQGLPDVLSSDGHSLYMRHMRLDLDGLPQTPDVPHLFSAAGFLDDSWWHRAYWMLGTKMESGWGGWPVAGLQVPAGRLLVLDDSMVYGFGRNQYARHGAHLGLEGKELPWPLPQEGTQYDRTVYQLFACDKSAAAAGPKTVKKSSDGPARGNSTRWAESVGLWARAMLLSDKILFLAGPPDVFVTKEGDAAAWAGAKGGWLWAVSVTDGKKLAEIKLDKPPVFDGMAAAGEHLFLATQDGRVICFGKR
jgi:hypothetical protein